MHRGSGRSTPFASAQIRELQQLLAKRGHDVGKIDGFLGQKSRTAVKAEQVKLGLPADSYPTPELVAEAAGEVSQSPLIPAKAGHPVLGRALGPRFRGDERQFSQTPP